MLTGDGETELSGIAGTVGAGPFVLNAFHGSGFAMPGTSFAPLADYRLPATVGSFRVSRTETIGL